MVKHYESEIKHAKEIGELRASTDHKSKKPFIRNDFLKGVTCNPYQWRTGSLGKKIKSAWHNGYRSRFNALS